MCSDLLFESPGKMLGSDGVQRRLRWIVIFVFYYLFTLFCSAAVSAVVRASHVALWCPRHRSCSWFALCGFKLCAV